MSERQVRWKKKVRKRVREALFSVVKGETGLCRFVCRTGKLLICPGRAQEEGEMAEQREGGRNKRNAGTRLRGDGQSLHEEKEEVSGTDGVQDSRSE